MPSRIILTTEEPSATTHGEVSVDFPQPLWYVVPMKTKSSKPSPQSEAVIEAYKGMYRRARGRDVKVEFGRGGMCLINDEIKVRVCQLSKMTSNLEVGL